MKITTKFTVIAVSSNCNRFGLKSIMILAASGIGWELLKSPYGGEALPKQGDVLEFEVDGDHLQLPAFHSYECPRKLPVCKPALAVKVIADVLSLIPA